MAIATLEKEVTPKTKKLGIDVLHLGETITFMPNLFGPGYYKGVRAEIAHKNLRMPTTAETLLFLDLALEDPGEFGCFSELLKRFRQHQLYLWAGIEKSYDPKLVEGRERFQREYLWTCTESFSVPEGILVYDNVDKTMPKTRKKLLELFNNRDKRVRLVEPGYQRGFMSLSDFLNSPYTKAQIGEDMLETAERVAKVCNEREAFVFGPDKVELGKKSPTALFSDYGNYNGFCLNGLFNFVSHSGSAPAIS